MKITPRQTAATTWVRVEHRLESERKVEFGDALQRLRGLRGRLRGRRLGQRPLLRFDAASHTLSLSLSLTVFLLHSFSVTQSADFSGGGLAKSYNNVLKELFCTLLQLFT